MFPQTAAAAAAAATASGHTRLCLGYMADEHADGAKEHGDRDAWLQAGTGQCSESIRLVFGGENIVDAAAIATRAAEQNECGHIHNSGFCLVKSKWWF